VPTTKPMPESNSEQPQLGVLEDVREQLKFEMLLADLSARFVNVLLNQVDREIECAQKSICDHLDLDGSAVWQQFGEDPEFFHLTHLYRPLGGPPVPTRFVGTDYFPWVQKKLLSGEIVKVSDTKDVPPEAARDREAWDYYDIKSCVTFPFWTGDDRMFGCISFQTTRERRDWPEALVNRLKLLIQVFSGALARQRAEKLLHDSELRLRLAAASAGAGLWTLETVSGRIWATDKTKELFGFAPAEEFDLEKFLAVVHPEDREAVRGTIEQAIHSGEDSSIEYRIIRPDGETRWISARGCRRSGEFGEPDQLMGVSVDVTERKQLEHVLQESNARLSGIVTSAMDAIIAIDDDQQIVVFNAAAEKMFGYPAREAIGIPIGRFIPQRFQADHREHIRKFGATGVTNRTMGRLGALWAVRSNGEEFPIEATISQIQSVGKTLYTVIIRDVTESKRAQEELQKSYADVKRLEERLHAESVYLREEIKEIGKFHEIVGQSEALKQVLSNVEQVARADSVVLITGETGTGKELIARAIHNLSTRKERVMVKVDCAALPPTLIESELFGREKGAYTGALSKQFGRFETADGSTLFLDEIGELGVEVQAKLLRIVQDGEFERLGSAKTSHVNVRLIAATHRDLEERVKNGTFREDLFYRLNVFPIRVPPLRERPEDIPLLVMAFLREFERKMGKKFRGVPSRSMDELKIYSWPGNIRELRNVIERAVIVTTGEKLNLHLPKSLIAPTARTLKEADHHHILATLQKTGWRIKGPNGAATILGVKPSTLYTMMRRLNIPTGHEKGGMQS
jgi:formate hydrogenlyase transcriptional activator